MILEYVIIPSMKICKFCDNRFNSIYPKKKFCSRKCKERFYNIEQYKIKKKILSIGSIITNICRICEISCKNYENSDSLCKKCYNIIFKRKEKGLSIETIDVKNDILKSKTRKRKYYDADGYVIILKKGHENSNKLGRIREHIFVMSEFLNRPLTKKETVHHKNGIKNDNRIENLELWSHSHPYGQRIEDKIEWAISFLKEYGYVISRA